MWNLGGFPDIFFDEGIYMRRAMHVMETGNPQEGTFYDHPYFGQLVLGGFLKLIGYTDIVFSSYASDGKYYESIYHLPRILMGVFAVLDTFLIYKITDKKFGKKTAILAAIIFAVMPFTWFLRRILLDNILLPLVLSSILFAIYSQDSKHQNLMILTSSVFLGLAIFTKITAITMIPVVAFLIISNQKKILNLTKWIIPVVLIPSIWPALSLHLREFNLWIRDVFWQAGRGENRFLEITIANFYIDPVFMVLSFASFVYVSYRKQFFLIFWFAPFLIFVNTVGFFQYFHYILILPIMAIAISCMIQNTLEKITNQNLQNKIFLILIFTIMIFGTVSSSLIINNNLTYSQYHVFAEVLSNTGSHKDVTVLAGPVYSWVLSDIYNLENVPPDYSYLLDNKISTKDVILIADPHFFIDINRGQELQSIYDKLNVVQEMGDPIKEINTNEYPYGSLKFTSEASNIEILTSFEFWSLNW